MGWPEELYSDVDDTDKEEEEVEEHLHDAQEIEPPESITTAGPTLATPLQVEEAYTEILSILYSFVNGDLLIAINDTTSRFCTTDPYPVADTTTHMEHDTAFHSNLDLKKYPKNTSATTTTSHDGTTTVMGFHETSSPYTTPPMSSSALKSGDPSVATTSPSSDKSTDDPLDSEDDLPVPMSAAIAAPLVVIAIVIALFCVCRRRRQKRKSQAGQTQEMKLDSGLPLHSTAPLIPPPTLHTQSTTSSTSQQRTTRAPVSTLAATAATDHPAPPVILNNNIGGAYLTGIDTSDALSVHSGHPGASNRQSLDGRSFISSSDDPPPPYRPCSVPPISRETSVRISNGNTMLMSAPHLASQLAPLSENNRSRGRIDEAAGLTDPFADPQSSDDEEPFVGEASTRRSGSYAGSSHRGNSNTSRSRQLSTSG